MPEKIRDDRPLADIFTVLPSKKDLPDYYQVIKQPVDIKKIKERINGHRYRAMDDLQKDFMLMCRNAQTYNIEGSIIYQDSMALQSLFLHVREKVEAGEELATNKQSNSDKEDDEDEEEVEEPVDEDSDGSDDAQQSTLQDENTTLSSLKMRIKISKEEKAKKKQSQMRKVAESSLRQEKEENSDEIESGGESDN